MPDDRPRPGWVTLPEVTGPTLEAELTANPAVVVHFWAEWNGYDMTMNRHLEAIRDRFVGRAAFFACDIDREQNRKLCLRLGVVHVPRVVVFVNCAPQERIVGNREPDALAAEIEARLDGERPVPKPGWFDRLLRRWSGESLSWSIKPPPRGQG